MKTWCLQIAEEEGWQKTNCNGGDGDDDDKDDEDSVPTPTLLWELAASGRWDAVKLASGLTWGDEHVVTRFGPEFVARGGVA